MSETKFIKRLSLVRPRILSSHVFDYIIESLGAGVINYIYTLFIVYRMLIVKKPILNIPLFINTYSKAKE